MVSKVKLSCLICLIGLIWPIQVFAADWPQLQNNPQRTGYSAETTSTNVSWPIGFASAYSGERLFPQVQPVVSGGKAMIGTEMGHFYAFTVSNGSLAWKFPATGTIGPIVGTAATDGSKVFIPSLDGKVYGVDINGNLLWTFSSGRRGGFSSSVLLAEGKIFIPDRGGWYYAIDPQTGNKLWELKIPAPILMSSAYNNGKIFVGANNMIVYAISTSGQILWQSKAGDVVGRAFKDYWPVAAGDYVFFYPMRKQGGATHVNNDELAQHSGVFTEAEITAQDSMVTYFNSNPTSQALFVFNQNTGSKVVVPHYMGFTMNGATCPPSIDGDGKLIMPVGWFWNWYQHGRTWGTGWGRFDTTRLRFTEVLWPSSGDRPNGNPDENMCTSAAGRKIFIVHSHNSGAAFQGVWNLDSRTATQRYLGSNADSYWWNNTLAGGTAPVVISGGVVFRNIQGSLTAQPL